MSPTSPLQRLLTNKALWAVVILITGALVAYYIMTSAPRPQRMKPQPQARLVDVIPLTQETSRPFWPTGGRVMAVDAVSLVPQVSGRVVWLNPQAVPGAVLSKGTVLVRLEQEDFRLKVKQAGAALVQAESDLAVEQGQGALAAEEYALAASKLSAAERALVMRKPQLAAAEAVVANARAVLAQAQLDLSRSEIRMPFDGQLSSRDVSVGSYATSSSPLFSIIGTQRVWIEVKVPRAFLNWLDHRADVPLTMPGWNGQQRIARVLNVLPDVDDADRQARVMLQLEQPLAAGQPLVLVNDYVDVQLPGREMNATVVETRLLNDDGSLWVVNNSSLLRRTPQVLLRGREKAWLGDGLQAGDQLLLNRIDSATSGMPVRVKQDSAGEQP